MRLALRRRMRWLAAGVLGTLGGLALAALLMTWSGVYSVAASRGHWRITEWALAFSMQNSVEARARFIETPPLDDPDLVSLGAGHFHGGCAYCHGAPGVTISPIARHMLPPPPDLAATTEAWKDRELFWIVKHGIKYTGMPAWVSQHPRAQCWRRWASRSSRIGRLGFAPMSAVTAPWSIWLRSYSWSLSCPLDYDGFRSGTLARRPSEWRTAGHFR